MYYVFIIFKCSICLFICFSFFRVFLISLCVIRYQYLINYFKNNFDNLKFKQKSRNSIIYENTEPINNTEQMYMELNKQ